MFFISWGSRKKIAQVGTAGVRHCDYCDKDSYFTRMVEYTVRHIYWIFRWVTARQPYLLCGNCGAAHHADQGDYDAPETRKAIPLWDRRGWLAGVGGIGALVATTSLAVAANDASDKTYIADPRAGDVYEADVAKIMVKPDAPQMYSAMRVVRVDPQRVELEVANLYYADMRGVDRDLSSGKAAQPGYYAPAHMTVPRSAIQAMYKDGVVREVQR